MADPTGHFGFGSIFKKAVDFGKGVGTGFVGAAKSTVHMVTHPKETAQVLAGAANAAFSDSGGGIKGALAAARTVFVDPMLTTVTTGIEAARTGDFETLGNLAGEALFDALLSKGMGKIKGHFRGGGTHTPSLGCSTHNSFTGDTLVVTGDGSQVPISQLEVSDEVWASDPQTGEDGPRQVTAVIIGDGVKDLVEITTSDGERIVATDEHPFWETTSGTWVAAGDLTTGDTLDPLIGEDLEVATVTYRTEITTVYNLTVTDLHTYHAGNNALLVHNCGGREPIARNGASLEHISDANITRIQNAADRIGEPIHLVGSRATGNINPLSDWDYVITNASSRTVRKVKNSLPSNPIPGLHGSRGVDILTNEAT